MEEKKSFREVVEEIFLKDSRYKPDSYEFILQALAFTQKKLNRKSHVTAKELLGGIHELAIEQYGPMAKAVLNHWGIVSTRDFGNIVFNMIDKKLLSKTEKDSLEDFHGAYELEEAFGNVLRESVVNLNKSDAAKKDR